VSHLGELLSALVDGELSGAELDRANAHLATCGACQAEAAALRRLKRELRALAEVNGSGEVARRLLAMTGQAVPAQGSLRHQGRRHDDLRRRGRFRLPGRRGVAAPQAAMPAGMPPGRRRIRYVLWTAISLVVVGIGTAAFGMGGGTAPEPKITPQLEVFDMRQAVTSGDVPFDDPADVSARVPVVAGSP